MMLVVAVVEVTRRHPSDVDDVLRGDIWEYLLCYDHTTWWTAIEGRGVAIIYSSLSALYPLPHPAWGNITASPPWSSSESQAGRLLLLWCQKFMLYWHFWTSRALDCLWCHLDLWLRFMNVRELCPVFTLQHTACQLERIYQSDLPSLWSDCGRKKQRYFTTFRDFIR